jgi:hypothetical protein
MSVTGICDHCGCGFYPNATDRQRYCSLKCVGDAKRSSPYVCSKCGGTDYRVTPSTGSRYCIPCGELSSKRWRSKIRESPLCLRACLVCGDEFPVTIVHPTQKYCSIKCSQKRPQGEKKPYLVCRKCGGNNLYPPGTVGRMRCKDCQKEAARRRNNRVVSTRECLTCGTVFDVLQRNKRAKYCSCGCFGVSRRGESYPQRQVKKPRPAKITYTCTCRACGTVFIRAKEQMYCSYKCSGTRRKKPSCGYCPTCRRVAEGKDCILRARKKREAHRQKVKHTPDYIAKHNGYKRTRRAREKGSFGSFSVAEEKALYLKQGGKCAVCLKRVESKTYHRDHIVPLARGGSNLIGNIQILCRSCNMEKRDRDPIEFMQSRGFLI